MSVRLALRRLAATPAFTAGAIVVLALGSGATLAVFTVLNALVFKTLPVSEPDRLVAIEVQTARGEPAALPIPLFETLVTKQQSLDRVAGLLGGSVVSADARGVIHQAVVDGVTADYFPLLGVSMIAGRPLGNSDSRSGGADADPVCVVSEGYARRVFGSTSNAKVRLSLGASPAALHRAVTARAIRLATAGTAAGATATWMLSRAQTATASLDWPQSSWAVAGACGLLLVIAVLAARAPARRAARTEPMTALRSE